MIIYRLLSILLFIFMALSPLSAVAVEKKIAVLYDKRMLAHDTGIGHPETPRRIESAYTAIKNDKLLTKHLIWPSIKEVSDTTLQLVHTKKYIDQIAKEISTLKATETAYLSTGDVVISRNSDMAARVAVGSVIEGVNQIMTNVASSAFALVRPPGHHASFDKGMGFCIYNNIAIAARYLQQQFGLERILIVDFDVHHGNGTQDIFYEDPSVFYFSVHQHPLYPGTGSPQEIGSGKGEGYTLNVELPRGSNDSDLVNAFNDRLVSAMKKYKPEFILVSAGFDGHHNDPLGELSYSHRGYQGVAKVLSNLSREHAKEKIMYVVEGGYSYDNMSQSILAILHVLEKDRF